MFWVGLQAIVGEWNSGKYFYFLLGIFYKSHPIHKIYLKKNYTDIPDISNDTKYEKIFLRIPLSRGLTKK